MRALTPEAERTREAGRGLEPKPRSRWNLGCADRSGVRRRFVA